MRKDLLKYLLIIAIIAFAACSDDNEESGPGSGPDPSVEEFDILPKKDMRAVWFTTVWELDWPRGDNKFIEAEQKKQYIDYLETLVENNFNTIFVQVRSMADAFYNSPYEPWSKVITGTAGKDPGYDVLAFMLEEAHKRGLEFHAWINPYRINTKEADKSFPALSPMINKKWVKEYSTIRMYNPALPEVQEHIVNIVKDIITKYDVDGIAFDDYFYPEGIGGSFNDEEEFKTHGKDFSSIEDFRRDNVNKVIKGVQEVIKKEKPGAVFSISPAADINKNYKTLYADIKGWIKEGWVDIITPQLYFATGSNTGSFNNYLTQWEAAAGSTPLMIAYPLYKFYDENNTTPYGQAFKSSQELRNQFNYAIKSKKVVGGVMYSTKYLNINPVNIMGVIKDVYKDPAIRPFAGRKTLPDPKMPEGIKVTNSTLSWSTTKDLQYAIYLYKGEKVKARLLEITNSGSYKLPEKGKYFITAINKDNVESKVSDFVTY